MITKKDKALATLRLIAKAKLKTPVAPPRSFTSEACALSEKAVFTGVLNMSAYEKIVHKYGKEVEFLVKMPDYYVLYHIDEDGEGDVMAAGDLETIFSEAAIDVEEWDRYDNPVYTEAQLMNHFDHVGNIYLPGSHWIRYRSI